MPIVSDNLLNGFSKDVRRINIYDRIRFMYYYVDYLRKEEQTHRRYRVIDMPRTKLVVETLEMLYNKSWGGDADGNFIKKPKERTGGRKGTRKETSRDGGFYMK